MLAGLVPEPSGPRGVVGLSPKQDSVLHMLLHIQLQMGVNNPHRLREGISFFCSLVFNIEFQPGSRSQLLSKDLQENPFLLKLKRSVFLDVSMVKIINAAHSYPI